MLKLDNNRDKFPTRFQYSLVISLFLCFTPPRPKFINENIQSYQLLGSINFSPNPRINSPFFIYLKLHLPHNTLDNIISFEFNLGLFLDVIDIKVLQTRVCVERNHFRFMNV